MSVETDFRALLAGAAGVTALVGNRIAQDAVPEGATYPLVVFATSHNRLTGLDGVLLTDQCSIAVQCWAIGASDASALGDAVVAAIATAPSANGVTVLDRSTTFEPDLNLHGVVLTVDWWQLAS